MCFQHLLNFAIRRRSIQDQYATLFSEILSEGEIEMDLAVAGFWIGMNLLWTLLLALNVTRLRLKLGVGIGLGGNDSLQRAIRAHGNNIEYTPLALLGLATLAALGLSTMLTHILGGGLLLGRIMHAIGIQEAEANSPAPRVIGNFITWAVFLCIALLLITSGISAF